VVEEHTRYLSMNAINLTTGKEMANRLTAAEKVFSRMKGLLGKNSLASGEGLLIRPCKGIHTFGMRFPIDALFLDKNNQVVATVNNLHPNKITRLYLNAESVIEFPSGTLEATSTKPGDRIEIV
jgi:uncharacterized membrane protein (UPF0127 family)